MVKDILGSAIHGRGSGNTSKTLLAHADDSRDAPVIILGLVINSISRPAYWCPDFHIRCPRHLGREDDRADLLRIVRKHTDATVVANAAIADMIFARLLVVAAATLVVFNPIKVDERSAFRARLVLDIGNIERRANRLGKEVIHPNCGMFDSLRPHIRGSSVITSTHYRETDPISAPVPEGGENSPSRPRREVGERQERPGVRGSEAAK